MKVLKKGKSTLSLGIIYGILAVIGLCSYFWADNLHNGIVFYTVMGALWLYLAAHYIFEYMERFYFDENVFYQRKPFCRNREYNYSDIETAKMASRNYNTLILKLRDTKKEMSLNYSGIEEFIKEVEARMTVEGLHAPDDIENNGEE